MDADERQKLFGKKVEELRTARGFSDKDLADMIGNHRSYIWKVENGIVSPKLKTLMKIADALGVPVSELVKPCDLPA